MRVLRDVRVPMRDGAYILVDIFRPEADGQFPVLIAWGPYGKHALLNCRDIPGAGVEPEWVSRHASFEGPDPVYWVAHGYAVVHADPRGTWATPGDCLFWDPREALDCHDLVEWLGTREWSNGRVGMTGVSYLAIIQWYVAATRPPHLAAINPWEGFSDLYRDFSYHGGIPETRFSPLWLSTRVGFGTGRHEDLVAEARTHPLFDEFWQYKVPDLSTIDVPAFVVAGWGDHGLHTRGTIAGFERIGSARKWLDIHGQQKWGYYYNPANVDRQRLFFDRFLLDRRNEVDDWPRVRFEVRAATGVGQIKHRAEWPVAETEWRRLYLDAASGALLDQAPADESSAAYHPADPDGRGFDFTFGADTDVVGTMALTLWFECRGFDDADIFVSVQKLDANGNRVCFPFYTTFWDGDVALGWLRASHREDPAPDAGPDTYLSHSHERKLKPGEIVPLTIEIWPSGTHFSTGDTLRVIVKGRDTFEYGPEARVMGHSPYAEGVHVIHTGDQYPSLLTLPVLPVPDRR